MIELPRHSIDTWTRCHRKWYYQHELGLEPKQLPDNMVIGDYFHHVVASMYRGLREKWDEESRLEGIEKGLQSYIQDHPAAQPYSLLVEDMATYWWENQGKYQQYDEIIAVEETFFLDVGPYRIPWTADLIARRPEGTPVIVDHKTVGNVKEALEFLAIDFQLRRYAAGFYKQFNEVPELDYNMVRRELPPDFTRTDGSTPYALTPTGRDSTRSKKSEDYLQLHRLIFTPKQINATLKELEGNIGDMLHAKETEFYARSEIKGGAFGCASCPYLGPCAREFDGNKLDGITLKLLFNKTSPGS